MKAGGLALYNLIQPTISLVRVITVFTIFRLLTDFVCLYTYEFWLSLWKIVRSSVILLLPLFVGNTCSIRMSVMIWASIPRLLSRSGWPQRNIHISDDHISFPFNLDFSFLYHRIKIHLTRGMGNIGQFSLLDLDHFNFLAPYIFSMQYRNETHTQNLSPKMIYIKEQFDIYKQKWQSKSITYSI